MGYIQKIVGNNILEIPKNPPWGFLEIQDGIQDGRRLEFFFI